MQLRCSVRQTTESMIITVEIVIKYVPYIEWIENDHPVAMIQSNRVV